MKENKKTEWMSIRLPPSLRDTIKKDAEKHCRSMASHVIYILSEHMKKSVK
jgi:hypothetical protein